MTMYGARIQEADGHGLLASAFGDLRQSPGSGEPPHDDQACQRLDSTAQRPAGQGDGPRREPSDQVGNTPRPSSSPYCAAERWAITAAVSRFGTLSGLHFIHSSPSDAYPSTPTLTFCKSSYTSKYLAFAPVEWYGESRPQHALRARLPATANSAEAALFKRYSGGSVPFVDIGNLSLCRRLSTCHQP
jgi:hypothetical protein